VPQILPGQSVGRHVSVVERLASTGEVLAEPAARPPAGLSPPACGSRRGSGRNRCWPAPAPAAPGTAVLGLF
jgi:hypothetical protein